MADIWIDVDIAVASAPVNIMPLIDDTDFKTRETSVAYNASGMDLVWNFTTTAGVTTQTAVTPTTGGNYDWTNLGDGMYAIEIPASGGASINNDTEGFGWFTGFVTGVLPWRGPIIGFRAAALNNSLIDAGTTGLLAPTTAARTLDVSAAGNAGIDWSNVEAPTTTLGLTNTTVGIVTLVNGLAAGTITAAAIATGAIDADAIADGAIDAGSIAADAITAAKIADGAIDAATFAANSITASALAADAVTEIQSGLATSAALATVQSDTDNIQTRLPAALVSGRMDSSVGAMAADTITASAIAVGAIEADAFAANSITASALAADAVTEIQSGLATAASIAALNDLSATEVEDAVWDAVLANHLDAGSTGAALNAAGAAGDPWSTTIPGAYGAGSAGFIVGTNLDTTVSSRLAPTVASRTLDVTVAGNAGIDWSNVENPTTTLNLSGTSTLALEPTTAGRKLDVSAEGNAGIDWSNVHAQSTTVNLSGTTIKAVTDGVVVATNSDKTGYTTTQADQQNSADEFLNRNLAGSGSGNTRNVRNALRPSRNKVEVVTGVATVYEEDDTTPAWEADITTTAGDPITAVDPTT